MIDVNRPNAQVLEEFTPDGTVRASYTYGLALVSQERVSDRYLETVNLFIDVRP